MSKRHRATRAQTLHEVLGTEPATSPGHGGTSSAATLLAADPLTVARQRRQAGDGLGALEACRSAAVDLEMTTRRSVEVARAGGATWEQVAEALGLASKQAAHARYGTL